MIGQKTFGVGISIGGKISASLMRSIKLAETKIGGLNRVAGEGRKTLMSTLGAPLWQGAAAGAAGVGLALAVSVKQAAAFEQVLTDISKTANLGAQETKALGAEILALTGSDKTNQSAEKLGAGIKTLVGSGLTLAEARGAILGIGRVATATGSEITEVADTSYQLIQNLGIRSTEVASTFEILAAAGKKGSFELKDMAREFPRVASSAQKLGIGGREGAASLAAMLQVVRRGAPDAATAANNLVNLLEKLTGKDAVKNFAKFGVDIEQVVKDAQANGLNPLEESLKVIQRITKGDAFRINELFGDMQVKAALAPLLKDFADFEKIRDGSLSASGVIDKDYEKQLGTLTERMNSFRNAGNRLAISTGTALLPALTDLAKGLLPLAEGFGRFANANPKLAAAILITTGALAGLVALTPFIAATITVIGALGALGLGPIGLIALAVIGAGLAFVGLYKRVGWFRKFVDGWMAGARRGWGGLMKFITGSFELVVGIFTGDGEKMKRGWGRLVRGLDAMWRGWCGTIAALFRVGTDRVLAFFDVFIGLFTGDVGKMVSGWQRATDGLGPAMKKGLDWAGGAFGRWVAWIGEEAYRRFTALGKSAGERFAKALIQGMKFGTPQGILSAIVESLLKGATTPRSATPSGTGLTLRSSPADYPKGLTLRTSPADYATPPAAAAVPAAATPAPVAAVSVVGPAIKPADYATPPAAAAVPAAATPAPVAAVSVVGPAIKPGAAQAAGSSLPAATAANRITPTAGLLGLPAGGMGAAPTPMPAPQPYGGGRGFGGPMVTMEPGAIQVTVGSGDPAAIERAVASAMEQFQYRLESSYRSMLSD